MRPLLSRKDFRFNAFTGSEQAGEYNQLAELSFGSDRMVTGLAALAQLERQSLLETDLATRSSFSRTAIGTYEGIS
jgi:hypothetical protein